MTGGETWVCGVDGCRAGWMVVMHPLDAPSRATVSIVATFADILSCAETPAMIAVDIPIGLPERSGLGGRLCDSAARVPLGDRRSSVFSVPARAAVAEHEYAAACRQAAQFSDPSRKVSKQAFNLFAKIREVDALMTPALQARVVECHPELAFWRLNGRRPLDQPKKVKSQPHGPGLDLRRQLLHEAGYPRDVVQQAAFRSRDAGEDDVIDAFANAAAAAAILRGEAFRVPDTPPVDGKGLRMEIWG